MGELRTKQRAIALGLAVVACLSTIVARAGASAGDVTEWNLDAGSSPEGIATGSDGNLWIAEPQVNTVAVVTPDGELLRSITVPGRPSALAARGDAMWALERGGDKVARIAADGVVSEFAVPGAANGLQSIALGPDDALWFTERSANQIGRVSPDGTVTEYNVPTVDARPFGIAAGPDGNLWFTESGTASVGRIRPDGTFLADIALPASGAVPQGIAAGRRGDGMWAVGAVGGGLLRIDASTLDVIERATQLGMPVGVVAGPDRAIWLTERTGNAIARVDLQTYALDQYSDPSNGGPAGIAVGPDQNVWFTASGSAMLGRVETVKVPPDTTAPTATINRPAEGATYTVGDTVRADYSCADETDGSGIASCAGTVDDGATIDTGTPGAFAFTVTATDAAGNSSVTTVHYTVARPKPADTTAPVITLDVPQDGAAYMVGDRPIAEFSCTDAGGSGLASCRGTFDDGSAIDTSRPGIVTFTGRAADAAGNTSALTHTYVVFKDWGGKLALAPAMNEVQSGSAVPIWFNLGDTVATTQSVTSPTSTPIDCTSLSPTGPTVPASVSPTGAKASNGRVMYVWKTDRAWAGSCRAFTLGIAAPTTLYLHFS